MLRLGLELRRRQCAVRCVQRIEVALDALFNLLLALLDLAGREVAVTRVDGLELAAIDGDHGLRKQLQLSAQFNEAPAHVADAFAVVAAEVSNRLEVRRQAARQPHQFDIALRLPLKTPAGLQAIEIAVDVDLEQHGRVIRRPASRSGFNTFKAQVLKIQLVDERVDHADRVVVPDEVVQALWQQGDLASIFAFDESLHVAAPAVAFT